MLEHNKNNATESREKSMASLPQFEPVHRLFLALPPPPELAARMTGLQQELGLARPVPADRLHLTLLLMPDYAHVPDGLAEAVAEEAARVRMPPFRVILDRAQGNGRNLVLQPSEPIEALAMFRERLGLSLVRAGIELRPGYRFSPHVTLSYNDRERISAEIEPLSWLVEEFVLIHSFVGLTKHVELGRWRLG